MSVQFLLACDTFPPNPWYRDRLPAIREASSGFNFDIMDIYEFNSREEAHKLHELKGWLFFTRRDIDLYDLNQKFYNRIMSYDCNILILGTVGNYAWFLLPETVKKLQEDGIFVVGILGDDEYIYKRNQLYVPMFDKVIAYVRKCVDYYNAIKPESCYYLPNSCYFPEHDFSRLQIDEEKKKFGVTLMGSPFGVRPKLIRALVDAGVNVALFGSAKWQEYSDLRAYYHGYVPSEDIGSTIQASKIILAPLEDHLTGALHMDTKIWDAVKYGQMCIATRYLPLTVDYGLVENEDIVMYDSPEDLVDRVTYYLDNPAERIRIAENLFRKTKERFDYAKMYGDLFQNLEQDFLKKGINGHTEEPIASQVTILDHSRNGEIHPGFENVRLQRSRGWRQALRQDFQHLVKTPYVILTHGGFSYSPYLNKLVALSPDEFVNGKARLRPVLSKSYSNLSGLVEINAFIWEKDALFNQYVTKRFRYAYLFQGPFSYSFANLRLCEANEEGRVLGILVFLLRFKPIRVAMRVARNVARRINFIS